MIPSGIKSLPRFLVDVGSEFIDLALPKIGQETRNTCTIAVEREVIQSHFSFVAVANEYTTKHLR